MNLSASLSLIVFVAAVAVNLAVLGWLNLSRGWTTGNAVMAIVAVANAVGLLVDLRLELRGLTSISQFVWACPPLGIPLVLLQMVAVIAACCAVPNWPNALWATLQCVATVALGWHFWE